MKLYIEEVNKQRKEFKFSMKDGSKDTWEDEISS